MWEESWFDRLVALPWKAQVCLAYGLLGLLLSVGCGLVLNNQAQQRLLLEQQIEARSEALEALRQPAISPPLSLAPVVRISSQQIPAWIERLSQMTTAQDLVLTQVKVFPARTEGDDLVYPVGLTLEGSYARMVEWFKGLGQYASEVGLAEVHLGPARAHVQIELYGAQEHA